MKSEMLDRFKVDVSRVVDHIEKLRFRNGACWTSDITEQDLIELQTRIQVQISRICAKDSVYVLKMNEIACEESNPRYLLEKFCGLICALKIDLDAGWCESVEELVHGDMFADFLGMAQHLQDRGYKDAAAVIVGSSLESHLRLLCAKNDLPIAEEDGSPHKSESLNAELARKQVYTKLDQKNITAWLALRNKAAHGEYDDYTREQVSVFLAGVREFLSRMPA